MFIEDGACHVHAALGYRIHVRVKGERGNGRDQEGFAASGGKMQDVGSRWLEQDELAGDMAVSSIPHASHLIIVFIIPSEGDGGGGVVNVEMEGISGEQGGHGGWRDGFKAVIGAGLFVSGGLKLLLVAGPVGFHGGVATADLT